jgi:RNA-directed DNA polymerase
MVRYADDFIITGTSKELLEGEVKPFVEQFMKERGLELSQEKTVITCVDNGFDFLGHHVRKYNGTYLAKPSRKNVHAFLEKVRRIVKANKQAMVEILLGLLNPVIRGWAT